MQWGEPISVFDSSQVRLTKGPVQRILVFQRIFKSSVTDSIVVNDKLVTVYLPCISRKTLPD
jgi:hypothetical protein